MSDLIYATVLSNIKPFFEKIHSVGIPEKVTYKWLQKIGFKSSNDRRLKNILEALHFIKPSGEPTELWQEYRGNNHKRHLARAIKEGYQELFNTYPNAHNLNSDEIANVFRANSDASDTTIGKAVSTFQTLCQIADFSNLHYDQSTQDSERKPPIKIPDDNHQNEYPKNLTSSPSIHIDIQIHLSPDMSSEKIDDVFKSMAKHLYK